ncbi:antiviral reverse transcriptase Drt5 [Phaeobacter inhibens]|uniref:antiviral reverse transcriptase Drt5 n=1 Tax=Phaeobacter inhibens TaxID=221822 RepID=UPI0021A48D02|nr:antiviral reverse transcriptase Drt5 [Phaeobacter inhibens]UWR51064.1 RNA-directed DNA polymerase [Phaeobacter inhibens]
MFGFYSADYRRMLFPMSTNRYLIENGQVEIAEFLNRCLDPNQEAFSFRSQTRVYAGKPGFHLRRTVKLDPVAEYFIYDLVLRNRTRFRAPYHEHKKHFGYRFQDGEPLNPSGSYRGYKGAIVAYRDQFRYSLSFDVAAYFNSIYHHDLVSWLSRTGASEQDYQAFGQFLREINTGRSVDCLPQGIYPAKMIGNDFLRFVEQFHGLRSNAVVRFMDDFVLFSDSQRDLRHDFITIQGLLGEKGLSLNPNKTSDGVRENVELEDAIEDVRIQLLQRRRVVITDYDGIPDEEVEVEQDLSDEEMGFLRGLLQQDDIEEEDAELVLALMAEHAEEAIDRLADIARRFPHLFKNIYSFCLEAEGEEAIAAFVLELLRDNDAMIYEFQLFWLTHILEDRLLNTNSAAEIIDRLNNHPNATSVSRAKLLEIPDLRYGLVELRDAHLGAGQSDWLSWSSAVGHRGLNRIDRRHRLGYFAKASNYNKLVFDIVSKD